jgi:hypothetical protein
VFHTPYNKLVQKSYGRLFLCDARRRYTAANIKEEQTLEEKKDPAEEELEFQQVDNDDKHTEIDAELQEWLSKPIEETYIDKTLEAALKKVSASSCSSSVWSMPTVLVSSYLCRSKRCELGAKHF